MFGSFMEKITGSAEKSRFTEGQIIKAPLELSNEADSSTDSAPVSMVEWRITMVGKDGLVHIMREPTAEEQQAMGSTRHNITMAATCRIEDLARWN
jgi:hypothetical protein